MNRQTTVSGRTKRGTSRRRVLGAAAAAIGALGFGGRAAAKQSIRADADSLVAGNGTFTVALEGVSASAIENATVKVNGIAFASVDVVPGEPPLLAIEVSNLLGHESIRGRDTVPVEVGVETGGERVEASDESRVVTDLG